MSLFVDIEKTFPEFHLKVKLECGNEVLALLGGSGCGKSLTLKCVAGIVRPDSGRIVIDGETVFDSEKRINLKPQKRRVGYLFQNYALFPNMTVSKNITCAISGTKDKRAGVAEEIIRAFQLEDVRNLYPGQISGGQQQRAALARILVSGPRILMLDEPFSALDSYLKWTMEREVASVLENFAGSTVFVSHDRDEVYRLSGTIAVMSAGKIDVAGTKEAIFSAPKTLAAAKITGCKNISAAEKRAERRVFASDWGVELETAQTVSDNVAYVGVRANHFALPDGTVRENTFSCRVHGVLDEPFDKLVTISFNEGNDAARINYGIPKRMWYPELEQGLTLSIPRDKVICLYS